jgi:hypothetical protein
VNLIRHGRTVCKSRLPACGTCSLRPVCPFPQQPSPPRSRIVRPSAAAGAGPLTERRPR